MAPELLSARLFRRPPPADHGGTDTHFRSLALEAHGCGLRPSPSPAEPIQVYIDVVQGDRLRFAELQYVGVPDELSVRECSFLVTHRAAESAAWEDVVMGMLMNFNLFPESHRQVRRELPPFLDEMAREARGRGFVAVRVLCSVEQVVPVVHSAAGEGLAGAGADDVTEGERLFLAAVAAGKIRVVVEVKREEDCAVCLDGLSEGSSEVYELCCLHVFHADCIRRWLQESRLLRQGSRCPVCRFLLYV